LSKSSACLLVAHGSRDPRPQQALTETATLLRQGFQSRGGQWPCPVGTAVLEFGPTPLAEQISDFATGIVAQGCDRLLILPVFLLMGVHVKVDLPAALAQSRSRLPPGLEVILLNPLGSHPALPQLLMRQQQGYSASAWVLLAHGSRHPHANEPVEQLAWRLQAAVAYWSVPPSLATVIQQLVATGHRDLGTLPYFLFAGSTADAIKKQLVEIQQQFPHITLHLAPFLRPSSELTALLLDLCLSEDADPIIP
jgi:sirohydrochlorin cobaltochelatase